MMKGAVISESMVGKSVFMHLRSPVLNWNIIVEAGGGRWLSRVGGGAGWFVASDDGNLSEASVFLRSCSG